MTREEAIKILTETQVFYFAQYGKEKTQEALDMAIDALRKAIPQKPKRLNKNDAFDGNWEKVCPACGRTLMERITTKEESYPKHYNMTDHCVCGQALDWR